MSDTVQHTVTVGGLTINAGTPIVALAERIRDLTADLADAKALADSEGTRAVAAIRQRREWSAAIQRAYGYLWHVNNEPGTPNQYPPERAAYEARKVLRDLLTHEQRGTGINMVHATIAGTPATATDSAPGFHCARTGMCDATPSCTAQCTACRDSDGVRGGER